MAGGGRRRRVQRGWSDLPDDILYVVYCRCCSSPYDRVHFSAVCTSWRAVSSWHPKLPFLPLLLPLTGNAKSDRKARAYSLEDGRALRRPLRGFPWGKQVIGSHDGGWIAASTGIRIMVINVFSGARVALSAKESIIGCKCPTRSDPGVANHVTRQTQSSVKKVIFSKDPSSDGCVLAAITMRCKIALRRIGSPDGGWTTRGCCTDAYEEFMDIAFCNGKLYGFGYGELFKFNVGVNEKGAPVVTSVHRMHIERRILADCGGKSMDKYIFELRNKLAIAVKISYGYQCCKFNFFLVFEIGDNGHTWTEVTSLDDHALFLGTFCKAVHVPASGWRSEVERNCIYYSEQRLCPRHEEKCIKRLDLGSYTVYYGKETEGVNYDRRIMTMTCEQRIMSRGYHYGHKDGTDGCIWVLPPNF